MAVHLHGHHVLAAGVEVGRDVELGHVARVLREAHVLAVDVEVEEGVDAVELQVHLLALPAGGHGEVTAIGAHFVAVLVALPVLARLAHHAAFPVAHLHLVLKDDALVAVEGQTVLIATVALQACHVPAHGHLHLVPSPHVVVGAVEVFGPMVGVGSPMKEPLAVERLPERTIFG